MMNYNPFSLEGKTVLVTGASSGIGRSIAIECSKMGARVVVTARSESRLNETLAQMAGEGHLAVCADLGDEDSIVNLVEQLPQLNGVVHNAGMAHRAPCKMVKKEQLEQVMSTNFEGPVLLQKYLLKKKKIEKEASIVFIASRAPFAPASGNAIYAASKGAMLGYAKCLGLEVAPQKIRVNSICPAMIWTDLVAKDAEQTGEDYKTVQERYPLKRFGKPEDVAWLAVYLLSDAAQWMTGSQIDITGGGELTLV
jgi:NAD(P)-dependent dehydrogenase (short-subunit alcohol dehydrogenase family)